MAFRIFTTYQTGRRSFLAPPWYHEKNQFSEKIVNGIRRQLFFVTERNSEDGCSEDFIGHVDCYVTSEQLTELHRRLLEEIKAAREKMDETETIYNGLVSYNGPADKPQK